MSLRQEREEEIADTNYSQGYQDGFAAARKAAAEALDLHLQLRPWPYNFGIRAFHLINVEEAKDKILDISP